jgi:hypothetical protein
MGQFYVIKTSGSFFLSVKDISGGKCILIFPDALKYVKIRQFGRLVFKGAGFWLLHLWACLLDQGVIFLDQFLISIICPPLYHRSQYHANIPFHGISP